MRQARSFLRECLLVGLASLTLPCHASLRTTPGFSAFIRETHYGRFWDFTADLQHADTAYTDIPLGLHTDSTYFSDPVGLQMFHLLSDRTTHEGGHSILSDGFLAAQKLKHNHPVLYELLSTLPVPTHASGGADARFEPLVHRPMLEHNHWGELVCVRYNNDDRAPVGQGPAWQGVVDLSSVGLGTQVEMVPAFYLGVYSQSNQRSCAQRVTLCLSELRSWFCNSAA